MSLKKTRSDTGCAPQRLSLVTALVRNCYAWLMPWVGHLLGKGVSWLSLEEKMLLGQARKRVGLDDFGDDSFREPLRLLLNCYETEADLNFIGRICVHHDILRLLGNRLRLVEDRRRFPDIAAEIIRRPLFITGLPRSGTTLPARPFSPRSRPSRPSGLGSDVSFPTSGEGLLRLRPAYCPDATTAQVH